MHFDFAAAPSHVTVLGSVAPVLLTGNFSVTLGPPASPVSSKVDPFTNLLAMVAIAG